MSIRYNNKVIAGMVEDRGGLEVCDIGTSLYIDETKGLRRWLNGQLVAYNKNTAAFFDKLQKIIALNPKLECTEEEWNAIAQNSPYGQCGKFVFYRMENKGTKSVSEPTSASTRASVPSQTVSPSGAIINARRDNSVTFWSEAIWTTTDSFYDENSDLISVKLPRIVRPILGLTDITQLGELERLDLEKGRTSISSQEDVHYPYFIQIATGQETIATLIDNLEIDINNPFSFFETKYSPCDLNNASWVKSNSQWNKAEVYPQAYEYLLDVYSGKRQVKGNFSIKANGQASTLYDFVIDTTNKRFKLPRLDGKHHRLYTQQLRTGANTKSYTIYGDGQVRQQGVLTVNGAGTYSIPLDIPLDSVNDYPVLICNNADVSATAVATSFVKGRTTNKFSVYTTGAVSISWEITGVMSASVTDIDGLMDTSIGTVVNNLYYYIGEACVRNAGLINVGQMNDALANKQDKLALRECYVVMYATTSSDGNSGCRRFSDGFIEQWGNFYLNGSSMTIVLPLTFTNQVYNVQVTDGGGGRVSYGVTKSAVGSFTIHGTGAGNYGSWYACGF